MKKSIAIILSLILVMAIMLPAAAISTVAVKSIKLNSAKITLKVGQTYNLKATLTPKNTTQKKLTYVTGNTKIATIGITGIIKGVSKGTTTITVYTFNKKIFAKCNVTILANVPDKFENLVVILPGEDTNEFDAFIKGDYGKRLKDELNMGLNYSFSPWGQYQSKVELTISAGERLDWCWNALAFVGSYNSKKMIQPLDDLINKYGSDIQRVNPLSGYKSAVFNGKIMAIPVNAPRSNQQYNICVRQDILESVGMTKVESKADLDNYMKLIKAKYPEMSPYVGASPQVMSKFELEDINWIRFGLTYAFYVDDRTNDDKIFSYYESSAFKDACMYARDWYKKGYIPEDVLVNKPGAAALTTGKAGWMSGSVMFDIENQAQLTKNVPGGKLKLYEIKDPKKPRYITSSGGDVQMIPITSKAPERTMMWINWIYKSQDNYDFHLKNGLFYEWMFRNANYMTFPSGVSKEAADMVRNWDKDAKYSKIYGFQFDESGVSAEVAQVKTVITQYIDPMSYGLLDYDATIEKALTELKKAGLGKIYTELQKQYSVWKTNQK